MYRSPSKLPHWQQASNPAYRRTTVSRRYRILLILAICSLTWYRYSRAPGIDIDKAISRTYPHQRQNIISKPHLESRDEVVENAVVAPRAQRHEVEVIPPPLLPRPVPAEVDQKLKSEPEDVGPSDRSSFKSGQSGIENVPPPLVKEASQKLIGQHLGPAAKDTTEQAKKTTKAPDVPGAPTKFPPYSEYAQLDDQAETLPDIIHIPFEDSVKDVILEGWEDLWFSDAELNTRKWGKLNETKIDFVYTCKSPATTALIPANISRGQWLRRCIPRNDIALRGQLNFE